MLTLLAAAGSFTFFVTAIVAARQAHATFAGYTIAALIGTALAVGNAWLTYKIVQLLARRTENWPARSQNWSGGIFLVLFVLWLPCANFIGDFVTKTVFRQLGM